MKKRSIFFLILILSFNIPLINSSKDEGYGEANDNLGQFTDTFENTDNITVMDDVIRNATLECIELNYTAPIGGFQDYTDYTQIEPNNRVDVISPVHVAHFSHRDEDSMLYYDYGVDYFDDFEHEMAFESDFLEGGGLGYIWVLSDVVDDMYNIYVADEDYIGLRLYRHPSSNDNRIYLMECDGGTYYTLDSYTLLARNTIYYLTIHKTGTTFWAKIYSDSARTVLVNTLSGTLQNDYTLRYIYGCSTYNDGADFDINNDVYNLTFGMSAGGYDTDGYIITEDYLNYTTGNSLTLLTNASIPTGTSMTVQFSNDNVTWVDNEGNAGSTTILDGFYAIDLRDLNYTDDFKMVNFTGTVTLTPRLYQLREVTTNGTGGVGGTVYVYRYPASTFIMIIFLFLIAITLVYGVSRKK